ncbi:MAG: PQQ-like beta-propeller repeat protein [Verrucomicrobiae bacterium]|nr:PQQ-like beta-propeller repeat protein [Verrucomicrobiae bacterium]
MFSKRLAMTGLLATACLTGGADDWPQWLGPQRDGVWRETGIVPQLPEGGLTARWRTPVGGGYAGPAVAGGRVYLLDRRLAPGASNPSDPFQRFSIPGSERVLCLEESTGRVLWVHEYECGYTMSYPAGPRTTPLVADGRVYTLGAEGNLLCLEASDGRVVWSHDFGKDDGLKTPMWGYAGHPLLDGDRLICLAGGEGKVAVAFDRNSGKVLWRALPAGDPGYSPPTMIELGGRRQCVIWHSESVNGLDPATGQVLWTFPREINHGLSIATPRLDGSRLFLTAFYDGPLMLELPSGPGGEPKAIWRARKRSEKDTTGIHSIIPTPFLVDGHIYGVCSYGQLRCLRADTGERLWETFAATTGKAVRWANAFLIRHEDRFFLFNERGDLILARLSPSGYEEIGRAHLIEPTGTAAGRNVVWSHPAFADRHVFVRNDEELACFSLAAPSGP